MGGILCKTRGLHNGEKDYMQTVPDKAANDKVRFTEETWKFNKTLLEYFTGIGYDLDSEK